MSDPIQLIEPDSLDTDSRHGNFWREFSRHPTSALVSNVQTKMLFANLDDQIIPITLNDRELENSYVCSPYNGVITYPLEEIRLLPSRLLRILIIGLVYCVAPALRIGRINRTVVVNNWLLSTNLHPRISMSSWQRLIDTLIGQYARHAILIRSLNGVTDAEFTASLVERGFMLMPSRQVYIFDGASGDFQTRHNTKIDQNLLDYDPRYRVVEHDQLQPRDFARMKQLYDLLYLEKYSRNNPDFSEQLISLWWKHKVMKYTGLRNQLGRLDGIIGFFECDGTISAPVVGYDTSLPQSLGLYRRLMALVLREAAERNLTLNLSSGAATFKRLRGGKSEIEYTAIYIRHLPWRQRMIWKGLAVLLSTIGATLLKRYEL